MEAKKLNEDLPFSTKTDLKYIMLDYSNILEHIASFQNSKEIMDHLAVFHAVYKGLFETFRKELRDDKFIDFVFDQVEQSKRIEGVE